MPTPELSATEALDEAIRAGAVGDEDRRWELISHLHVHGRDRFLDDPIDEWPDGPRTALAKYGEPLPG